MRLQSFSQPGCFTANILLYFLYYYLKWKLTKLTPATRRCFFIQICYLKIVTFNLSLSKINTVFPVLRRNGLDVFVQTFVKRLRKGAYRLYPYRGMRYAPVVNRGGNRHRKKGNECQCPSSNLDYYWIFFLYLCMNAYYYRPFKMYMSNKIPIFRREKKNNSTGCTDFSRTALSRYGFSLK